MDSKRIIWLFAFIGSVAGGYIPLLWDAGLFSMSSILCSGLGAMLGIWIGFKISR